MSEFRWTDDSTISAFSLSDNTTIIEFSERALRRVIDRELSRRNGTSEINRWLGSLRKRLNVPNEDHQAQIRAIVEWVKAERR